MLKQLCFITNKYPNEIDKNALVFLQQLIWEISDKGINCTVICPVPININPKYLKLPQKTYEKTSKGNVITIYFPRYIGFGQTKILGYNPAKKTTRNFTKTVKKVILKLTVKPDALYGHFITPSGISVSRIGRELNIPSFMAYGEATTNTINHFGAVAVRDEIKSLSGIIAVSTHSKNMLLSTRIANCEDIEVFPNGFRKDRFYPRNKLEARKRFGFPKDRFIVCFVGSFDHRKGIKRLMEATEELKEVYVICAGKGDLKPMNSNCLYNNQVNHEDLPYFYSTADLFVLPTTNEGCCNAIIEAMACGLPIVSSNLPFNNEILDESCSIKIDPLNVKEISKAIEYIYLNNEFREKLKEGSLKKSKGLTLNRRADKILTFINERRNSSLSDT